MQDKAVMQDEATLPNADPDAGVRADGLTAAEAATQRKLKAVVLGLGVLIMLAFAGVIAGMVFRASQIGKGPNAKAPVSGAPVSGVTASGVTSAASPSISPSQPGQRAGLSFLPELKLALPPGSRIKSTSLNGQSLAVHHEGLSGAGIVILDLTSGQIVSRVVVEPAAAKP
jgi:hypothetical protein